MGAEKTAADFYHLVAQKVETEGAAFITKQKERITGLLSKKDSVTPAKLDDFQIKHNILSAFE